MGNKERENGRIHMCSSFLVKQVLRFEHGSENSRRVLGIDDRPTRTNQPTNRQTNRPTDIPGLTMKFHFQQVHRLEHDSVTTVPF